MIIKRDISKKLIEYANQYPVVTITGPRQSGKTTLVRTTFPNHLYFSLENPDIKEFALTDPRGFLEKSSGGMILDEIQNAPELLSYIQGIVDENNLSGQFILTGSQQFQLMKGVTQSLAGRNALLKLLPFTIHETASIKKESSIDSYLLKGFYPRVWEKGLDPRQTYMDYFQTYIQRDLRDLALIKDLSAFQRFVRLCAGRTGQIFVASNLSNELGVSVPTIKSWLSILETSYVVFLLQPYYENIGKQLVKSPKLYFYDVGLASYLLGIENINQLERDPLRGALFENLVIMEVLKKRYNLSLDANIFFYRDKQQHEVDLILKRGNELNLVEIKSAKTFQPDFFKGNNYLRKIFGDRIKESYVVYNGEMEQEIKGTKLINVMNVNQI